MKSIITIVIALLLSTSIAFAQVDSDKVIIVQKQSISWGNIQRGRANTDSFKKQTQLILPKEYTLKKADIYFAGANFPIVDMISLDTQNLDKVQDIINKCISGSVIYVDKILVVNQTGQETFLSSAGFILY